MPYLDADAIFYECLRNNPNPRNNSGNILKLYVKYLEESHYPVFENLS